MSLSSCPPFVFLPAATSSASFPIQPHRDNFRLSHSSPSPSLGYYHCLSFVEGKMLVSSQTVLKLLALFNEHSLCRMCSGENQQKKLYEVQLWAWHCLKLAALTGAARWRDETIKFIKTSGISDAYSPYSATYFSFILLEKEMFCPCMNLGLRGGEENSIRDHYCNCMW